MKNMLNLSSDILNYIYTFIPVEYLVVLDKKRYKLFHSKLLEKLPQERFYSYLRNIVRMDSVFVLKHIIVDYKELWNKNRVYCYKNNTYPSYSSYLLHYSKELGSIKCNELLKEEYNTELKQHKKVRSKKSRWSY